MKNECRENWIYLMAESARKLEAENPNAVGAIVMPDRVIWIDTRKLNKPIVGVAKCNMDEDEFDLDTGLAIAYARAEGIKVPECVLNKDKTVELRSLAIDDVFELGSDKYVVVLTDYNVVRCYSLTLKKSYSILGNTKVRKVKN